MYAGKVRRTLFYQFPIGTLTLDQLARFLRAGRFHADGTKGCTCCTGAIYVVHIRCGWDRKKFPITSNPSESVPDKNNITEADLDRDAEFDKAQAAWDMLRNDPLYMKATKDVYQRRKHIYLDARFLQRLARKIRYNHPAPATTPTNRKNNVTVNKGGRPRSKKSEWIIKQFGEGLTPAKILDKWDGMSDDHRKSIDPRYYHPFVSPRLTDKKKISAERKKARGTIDKLRPKKARHPNNCP